MHADLFPFGNNVGDTELAMAIDKISTTVNLTTPVIFFEEKQHNFSVSCPLAI